LRVSLSTISNESQVYPSLKREVLLVLQEWLALTGLGAYDGLSCKSHVTPMSTFEGELNLMHKDGLVSFVKPIMSFQKILMSGL
jgi:hypothetical protein